MLPTPLPCRRRASAARGLLAALAVLATGACQSAAPGAFSYERSAKHVRILATAIGSRPTGTEANRRAREYVADQLRQAGFTVRLQEAAATTTSGMVTPVTNIIGVRPGQHPDAVALVSHYDSPPDSPGAADDAMGVAVCLEAARVLAGRAGRRHSIVVAITDAEELGLMGARALVQAPEFAAVQAFLNFEATGTNGPAHLFQAGPGNAWLAASWAASAPFPSGSSLFIEIYRRLPNDTDFTILEQGGRPGLDFAPTGNHFAYHTSIDTPDRLERATMERLGENAIRLVDALDAVDLRVRTADTGTFFDVARWRAWAFSTVQVNLLVWAAAALGLIATIKAFRTTRREIGTVRIVLSVVWTLLVVAGAACAMTLGCWALRGGRALVYPWYGQAGLFLAFLSTIAVSAVWLLVGLGRMFPTNLAPCGRPACIWTITLPIWTALTVAAWIMARGGAYLFAIPLTLAAVLIIVLPVRRDGVARVLSAAVALGAGVLWIPMLWPLFEFAVSLLGGLPVAAPAWVFPALLMALTLMWTPAAAGLVLGRETPAVLTAAVPSILLLAVVALSWLMAVEPAYSVDRPEVRAIRYVHDTVTGTAIWEVGTVERAASPAGTDPGSPTGWLPAPQAAALSLPLAPVRGNFTYRTNAPHVAPPIDVRSVLEPTEVDSEVWIDTTAVCSLEGTGVAFSLPPGLTPREANLPGAVVDGRWRVLVMPAPASGARLRLRLSREQVPQLADARLAVIAYGLPGGTGWQRLPPWLPRGPVVWRARAYYLLAWPAPHAPDVAGPDEPVR